MLTTYSGSALNVAFPSILADFDIRRTTLGWALSGYSIASASLLLVAGRLADRIGGRRVFLVGAAVFTGGALVAGLAQTVEVLIIARVGQGFGAALMIPSSLSLALTGFPAARHSLAIAVWGGMAAIAGASGPPVGAVLVELGSWRWVFLATLPIGVAMLVGGGLLLDRSVPPRDGQTLDLLASPIAAVGAALLVAVLLEGGSWGWTDPRILAAATAALGCFVLVVRRSRHHPTPLLDLSLFKDRRFVVASSLISVFNAANGGYWLAAPLLLQGVWGWSVVKTGIAITPGPLTHLLFSPLGGRLADRGHHRLLMAVGSLSAATGIAWIAVFVGTGDYWLTIFPAGVLTGLSGALAWPTFTSAALLGVPQEKYGAANGVSLTMRQFGGAFGVAATLAALGPAATATIDDFRRAWIISATALALCALVLWVTYPARDHGR